MLLLALTLSRLPALEALPLHNDEGLHLSRAIEVWNLHPFWEIRDGKVINHWPIALFYPQNTPAFAGRIPTILVALVGLAAAFALAYRMFGLLAALLACALWITSPYLFFYERMAFSDAEAGALVVVSLWACSRFTRSGKGRDAILTGAAFGLATLFKFTAAPFALTLVLLVLFLGRGSVRQRVIGLWLIGLTVAALFAVPILYLVLRGDGFGIALGWIAGSGSGWLNNLSVNIPRFFEQIAGFGGMGWLILIVVGLVGLFGPAGRTTRLLGAAGLLPIGAILMLGTDAQSRHFVVALPTLLTLSGIGWAHLLHLRFGAQGALVLCIVLAVAWFGFAWMAYTAPGTLALPELARYQYLTAHSSGYGLREAMLALPDMIQPADAPVVGSMFPDSCRRANFYAPPGFRLTCADVPADSLAAALQTHGAVYVLAEPPPIGMDISAVTSTEARAELVAVYPRPGETTESASVRLWRFTRR